MVESIVRPRSWPIFGRGHSSSLALARQGGRWMGLPVDGAASNASCTCTQHMHNESKYVSGYAEHAARALHSASQQVAMQDASGFIQQEMYHKARVDWESTA